MSAQAVCVRQSCASQRLARAVSGGLEWNIECGGSRENCLHTRHISARGTSLGGFAVFYAHPRPATRLGFADMNAAVILVVVALHALVAFLLYRMAVRKGRSGAWALIGFASPLGWLIGFAVLSTREPVGAAADAQAQRRELEQFEYGTKECPACGNYSQESATECRKCRRPFSDSSTASDASTA